MTRYWCKVWTAFESGVYGVSARGSLNIIPNGSHGFTIGFPCGSDNAEKLTASALKELQNIIDNGPDEKDVAKFKEGELADFRKDSKENRYWLSNFTRSYLNGNSPEEVLKFEEAIHAVNTKDIQNIAKNTLLKIK